MRWLAAIMVLLPITAGAQVSDRVTTATITNSSGNCLAQNNYRRALTLDATAATQNIGYCQGVSCTAAIGSAGTTTLAAGALYYWPAGSAPINAFCFISASGNQPLTIREGL